MSTPRPAASRVLVAGVLLVAVGLVTWLLYRVVAGGEAHSFTPGSVAPAYVHLTAGETYTISVPGGVSIETDAGVAPATLGCQWTLAGASPQGLRITAEQTDAKATTQVARFVAPVTGRVHIECAGLPPVFVDNADDARPDYSWLFLVLASLALPIGGALVLSGLRRPQFAA